MLALCSMLSETYYARNYTDMIGLGLMTTSRILSGLTGIVYKIDNVLILGKTEKSTMSDLKLH